MVSYAMAIDKCNTNQEVFDVLNKLANVITDSVRKKYINRLVIHIFNDCLEEKDRNEIIEKINKGDGSSMKCSWDYIIEDFKRQKQEAQKAGFIEVIKRMIENGESIDKIKLYSGLSLKEIKKIEKDLNIVV